MHCAGFGVQPLRRRQRRQGRGDLFGRETGFAVDHDRRPHGFSQAFDAAEAAAGRAGDGAPPRSEEHTSELQSLMRISYAVFCLTKKTNLPAPLTSHNKSHSTTPANEIKSTQCPTLNNEQQ